MKLNIPERVAILQLLPQEGDIATLRIIRETQQSVGLGDSDYKDFDIKQEGTLLKWNEKGGTEYKDIDLGEKAKEIVKEALLKLDKDKKLTFSQIGLYEKFVQEKESK